MKIKANKDLHITTTWGAAIFLKAGEVREVGDDLGYQALAQGAVEDREVVEAPKPVSKKKTNKKTKTPTVNEAAVKVEITEKN